MRKISKMSLVWLAHLDGQGTFKEDPIWWEEGRRVEIMDGFSFRLC